jgi:hypothetical protein
LTVRVVTASFCSFSGPTERAFSLLGRPRSSAVARCRRCSAAA